MRTFRAGGARASSWPTQQLKRRIAVWLQLPSDKCGRVKGGTKQKRPDGPDILPFHKQLFISAWAAQERECFRAMSMFVLRVYSSGLGISNQHPDGYFLIKPTALQWERPVCRDCSPV